jgi:hypothetical protein
MNPLPGLLNNAAVLADSGPLPDIAGGDTSAVPARSAAGRREGLEDSNAENALLAFGV